MDYLIRTYPLFCEFMEESPLDQTDWHLGSQTYRLWWLPAFYRPIVVRLNVQPDGSGRIHAKIGELRRGAVPGSVIQAWGKYLSAEDIQEFLCLLDATDFWRQPTEKPVFGLDGFHWVMEGFHRGRYHVVDRWCPRSGPFREACWRLMALAGLELHGGKPGMHGTWFALGGST